MGGGGRPDAAGSEDRGGRRRQWPVGCEEGHWKGRSLAHTRKQSYRPLRHPPSPSSSPPLACLRRPSEATQHVVCAERRARPSLGVGHVFVFFFKVLLTRAPSFRRPPSAVLMTSPPTPTVLLVALLAVATAAVQVCEGWTGGLGAVYVWAGRPTMCRALGAAGARRQRALAGESEWEGAGGLGGDAAVAGLAIRNSRPPPPPSPPRPPAAAPTPCLR